MEDKDLDELKAIIKKMQVLLSHLSSALKEPTGEPYLGGRPAPNALALGSTAAALIKAQTTKLSLLVINKPFTPSAISTVLGTVARECIPALATAVQLASSPPSSSSSSSSHASSQPSSSSPTWLYPRLIHSSMWAQASTLFLEFQNLLREIPTDERGVSTAQNRGRDTFASTGVVWAACDALVEMGDAGAGEMAAKAAGQTHGLVKDAIDELREWLESGQDDEDEDGGDEEDSLGNDLTGGGGCPSGLRDEAGRAIRVVEHIRLLFPPIIKRRLQKFPALTARTKLDELPSESAVRRLDAALDSLRGLSEEVDELAGVLYEGDRQDIKRQVEKLSKMGGDCATSVQETWDLKEDELSSWLKDKWRPSLEEILMQST